LFKFEILKAKHIFGSEGKIGRRISKELKAGIPVHANKVSLTPVQIRGAG
jgi:hypothetical protein